MSCLLNGQDSRWLRCVLLIAAVLGCVACTAGDRVDAEALKAKLDVEIPTAFAESNSPTIQVAVIRQEEIIWSEAYGEGTSTEHGYMNASVQKTFTTAAILQLAEQGLVDLDADINDYVPFSVRHPEYPDTPITLRMLLSHRSGLGSFPEQFNWDTESTFTDYRPACPDEILALSHEEFLEESFTPGGLNYDEAVWRNAPGKSYYYSVSAYPFLRYVISQVSGQSYEDYMHANIFEPLGMTHSGFSADEFAGNYTTPHTRIDNENMEIPVWNGQASMMHTTSQDMARFTAALMNGGQYGNAQVLAPESIDMMRTVTSRFKVLFQSSDDLPRRGHGMGHFAFRAGWYGNGGSAPGYQCLLRYNPDRQVGYVILSNVNAILGGGENYDTARHDIYLVQDALVSVLDPYYGIRQRIPEVGVACGLIAWFIGVNVWQRRRSKNDKVTRRKGDMV